MKRYIDADKLKTEIERRKKAIHATIFNDEYNDLLAWLDSLQEEQPSEELEKYASRAGFDYVDDIEYKYPGHRWNDHDVEFAYRDGIIAGAEWQRQRTPMPEDTVLFNKGVAEGKRLMMEEAVEGEVIEDLHGQRYVKSEAVDGTKFNFGDRAKILIIKDK